MKCRKCGRVIEKCIANNPDCKEKRHPLCEDCNDKFYPSSRSAKYCLRCIIKRTKIRLKNQQIALWKGKQ